MGLLRLEAQEKDDEQHWRCDGLQEVRNGNRHREPYPTTAEYSSQLLATRETSSVYSCLRHEVATAVSWVSVGGKKKMKHRRFFKITLLGLLAAVPLALESIPVRSADLPATAPEKVGFPAEAPEALRCLDAASNQGQAIRRHRHTPG